jgi:undecaprenyl pyrophosphate phosphatase UppP
VASAFICGLVTISLFIRIAAKLTFWKFCIFLGVISLLAPLWEYS